MPETRTVTFNYTGAVQTFVVPNGVHEFGVPDAQQTYWR